MEACLVGGDSINSGLLEQLLRHENFSISAKAVPFHDKASSKNRRDIKL